MIRSLELSRVTLLRWAVVVIAAAALIQIAMHSSAVIGALRPIIVFSGNENSSGDLRGDFILLRLRREQYIAYLFSQALPAAAAALLAVLLGWRAGSRADARRLALFLALLAFWWGSFQPAEFRIVGYEPPPPPFSWSSALLAGGRWVAFTLAMGAFLSFATVFPSDARQTRLTQRQIWIPTIVVALGSAVLLPLSTVPVPSRAMTVLFVAAMLPAYLFYALFLFLGVRAMLHNYRKASDADRQRGLWLMAGFTCASAVFALIVVVQGVSWFVLDHLLTSFLVDMILPSLAPLVILVSIFIAVFYTGTFDARLIIKKTSLYSILGLILVGTFALVENVVTAAASRWFHLPADLGTFIGAIAVALVAAPLRARVITLMDGTRLGPSTAAISSDGAAAQQETS
ncbi:MAG: hypothetical protein WEE89_21235 [Gemmatimonadota bacterium]